MTRMAVALITVATLSVVLVGTALAAVPAIGDSSSIGAVANFLGAPQALTEPATSQVGGSQALPSTSTVADITGGLIAMGIALAAMALALVRRRSST